MNTYDTPAKQLRSITVAQLRELLADEDDDALVVFSAYSGSTPQAIGLRGEIFEAAVTEHAFSPSGFVVANADDAAAEADAPLVLVLR